jgi:hypothetical protein
MQKNRIKMVGPCLIASHCLAQVHDTHAILQNIDLREKTQALSSLQEQWDDKHHLNPQREGGRLFISLSGVSSVEYMGEKM